MIFGMNMLLWTTEVTPQHHDILRLCRDIGYDSVEIPIYDAGNTEAFVELGKFLDELGLKRTALNARGPEDNPISSDPALRAAALRETKKAVDCAVALNTDIVAGPIHSTFGVFTGAAPTEQEWAWGVEHMQQAAEYAKTQGVELSLEFLNRFECYFLNTTADTARFINDVGADNVGILYDTHHANIEEKNVGEAIREYGHLINHIHISENDRSTPGQGQVHWQDTFDAVRDIGYDKRFVVEAFGTSIPDLIPIVKVWRKMFDTEEGLARDALAFMQTEWAKRTG